MEIISYNENETAQIRTTLPCLMMSIHWSHSNQGCKIMVNYSKQNLLAEQRIESLSGGFSDVPWKPRLAIVPKLRGSNGRTFDLALILKAAECRRQ